MESKLKALKVVDLKELLQRAQVPIPPKANKPDLIQKIMDSPAALNVFEEIHGNGTKPSGASTPRPAVVANVPIEKGATEKDVGVTEMEKGSDILAPPEDFDWSAGVETTTELTTKPTSKLASNVPAKTAKTGKPASSKGGPPSSAAATKPPSKSSTAKPQTKQLPADEDEETAKRRARAERFGLPLVSKPAVDASTKTPKAPVATSAPTPAPAPVPAAKAKASNANGNGKKPVGKVSTVIDEDPEKLKARAKRFGLEFKSNATKPAAGATVAITGRKRGPPAESVDPEEEERRRKRTERFKNAA